MLEDKYLRPSMWDAKYKKAMKYGIWIANSFPDYVPVEGWGFLYEKKYEPICYKSGNERFSATSGFYMWDTKYSAGGFIGHVLSD